MLVFIIVEITRNDNISVLHRKCVISLKGVKEGINKYYNMQNMLVAKKTLLQISFLLPINMVLSLFGDIRSARGQLARGPLWEYCLLFNSRKSASCPRANKGSKEEFDFIKK